ncbi:MAG: serine hydrolase, partial [Kiloniellales bacterium]|nr:serine hydrolase [Kiloniellales bacterium]
VTGMTLSDYLSETRWRPLGMEADGNWVVDGSSADANEVAFCCLSATLRDYARFGLLMAQDGVWQGRRVLPEGWVREATRPDRPQVQPGKLYSGSPLGYQYQWWTFPGSDGAFTARGVNGQFIYVNPAEKLVAVLTGIWPYWWSENIEAHTYALFDAFAASVRD